MENKNLNGFLMVKIYFQKEDHILEKILNNILKIKLIIKSLNTIIQPIITLILIVEDKIFYY